MARSRIVGILFTFTLIALTATASAEERLDEVNFTIQDLWTSGEYATLYRKWFNAEPTVPIETWP